MKTRFKLAALMLGGLLGSAVMPAQAQPPEGKGQDHAPGKQKEQKDQKWRHDDQRDQKPERRQDEGRDRVSRHEHERDREHRHERDHDHDRRGDRHYPDIDETALRLIFREHRDWLDYDSRRDALPPGIRMNLQRGKPLPPGIAKRFDPRLHERLPYYQGHEWRRAGDKAILVDLATENVRFVLDSMFD